MRCLAVVTLSAACARPPTTAPAAPDPGAPSLVPYTAPTAAGCQLDGNVATVDELDAAAPVVVLDETYIGGDEHFTFEDRRATHAYLAAALRASTSEMAQRRGGLVPAPPPTPADRVGFTFDEYLAETADDDLAETSATVRALAARLRVCLPADWSG